MDWLTFLSNIINALAWPATLIVLLALIRKQLPQIARTLRRLKYKDIEMEFGETAEAIANEVKAIVPATQSENNIAGQEKSEVKARLEAIADLAPRAAILESWLQVEAAAADVIRQNNLDVSTPYPGPMSLRDSLLKGGVLDKRQIVIFEQLRTLRNEAAHVPDAEFTKAAVSNYIESAIAIASYLEGRIVASN